MTRYYKKKIYGDNNTKSAKTSEKFQIFSFFSLIALQMLQQYNNVSIWGQIGHTMKSSLSRIFKFTCNGLRSRDL